MFSQPSDFCCFGGEGCIAMPTRPDNPEFRRQGMFSQPSDFCCFGGKGCIAMPTRPDNPEFGFQRKRSTAKRLPARDGSERRQIPLPFFGAGEGSSALPE